MEIRKIYEYALQREYEGKRFFEENSKRLSHASAVDAFKKLAAEEQKHIEYIQRQVELLDQGHSPDLEMGETMEQAGFFTSRASSELIEQTISEAMVPDLPILRMAYLIERDFAEFYEQAASRLDLSGDEEDKGNIRKVFEKLAYWERRHEALFKQMHDRAFEEYAQMPWGG
jgi:rubrerythrin